MEVKHKCHIGTCACARMRVCQHSKDKTQVTHEASKKFDMGRSMVYRHA